ncbi:hypothetical protein GGI06_000982 [Coemansia sp. S85]|nr:hypothetical protein GGI06_000982 [Coemansia sp. S85]
MTLNSKEFTFETDQENWKAKSKTEVRIIVFVLTERDSETLSPEVTDRIKTAFKAIKFTAVFL